MGSMASMLVASLLTPGGAAAQAPLPVWGPPALQIEAVSPERTRVEITAPDGTKLFIEAHDVTVLPHSNLGGGTYVYFGQGKIRSSLNPDFTKEFPCQAMNLPNTRDGLITSVRTMAMDMNRGRWNFAVQKACAHRARMGLQ